MMTARVVQMIETTIEVRGKGTDSDPKRRIVQYWTLAGHLLFEVDGHAEPNHPVLNGAMDGVQALVAAVGGE